MKKAVILTYHFVGNAYSCLFYLKHKLDSQYDTSIWGLTHIEEMNDQFKNNYHSFLDMPYGIIPKVRAYIAKIHAFFIGTGNDIVIVNDFEFYIVAYLLKMLFPKKKIVFYCTEVPDADIRCPHYLIEFYKKHINFPDIIIDCLKERAEYRQRTYGLRDDYYIINNTIPQYIIDDALDPQYDASEYLDFNEKRPIVIYAGGCNKSRGLSELMEAVPLFDRKLNFVFFCHGKECDIMDLQRQCINYDNCRVYAGVNRKKLLNIMQYCDIGIQYYDPHFSINTKYASPSKFYEYLSLGLNVLSTDNEGINKMIKNDNLGICIGDDQNASDGLNAILEKGLLPKDEVKKIFKNKYSYEVDSVDAVNKIIEWGNQ